MSEFYCLSIGYVFICDLDILTRKEKESDAEKKQREIPVRYGAATPHD